MKISLLSFIVLFLTNHSFIKQEEQIIDFYADHHQYYYILQNDGTFKKFSSEHKLINQQNIKVDRSLSDLNTNNAMNLIAFFKEQQKIKIYDNFLNIISDIDINKEGLPEIEATCLSYDNKIWAVDVFNRHLYKLDWTGKILSTIENIENYGIAYNEVYQFLNQDQNIALHTDQGLYFLDQFGQYSHQLDIQSELLDIDGKHIIYKKDNKLYFYHIEKLITKMINIPSEDILKIEIKQNHLYILRKNGVDLYKLDNLEFKELE